MKMIDLTNQRFGKLTVIERVSNKGRHIVWRCACDCGMEKEVTTRDLRRGEVKTCRIKGRHPKVAEGEGAFNALYSQMRHNAIRRGYEWELTREQVKNISKKDCHYCGVEPRQIIVGSVRDMIGDYVYNGLDRIDNSIGYTIDNVVPCCGKCNQAKMDFGLIEFKELIISIYNHWIKPSFY